MKIVKYIMFLSITALLSVSLMNCGGEDGPDGPSISEKESTAISNLTGTWTIVSVTQDEEAPQIGDYSGLQVTFNGNANDGTGKTYSVTGGAAAFPNVSNATWTFIDPVNFAVIQRQDGYAMAIDSNTATTLVLRQDVTTELGPIPERVAYIGEYIYTFTK